MGGGKEMRGRMEERGMGMEGGRKGIGRVGERERGGMGGFDSLYPELPASVPNQTANVAIFRDGSSW